MRYTQKRSFRQGVAAAALCLFSCPASAGVADLHIVDWQDNPGYKLVTVRLMYEIEPGDLDKIKQQFKRAKQEGLSVVAIEMDSWGGDGGEAMAIGSYVHEKNLMVYVGGRCNSGCTFAVMAALGRGNLVVGPWASIGMHQAYYGAAQENRSDIGWTKWAADTMVANWNAPREPLDAMVRTQPSGFTRFGADDMVRWGAIKTGEWKWWILGW